MLGFKIKSSEGFTLVELMIATSLIGLLSIVGVSQFKQFRNKSKQVEAKIMLAHIYSLETAYFAKTKKYTHCLRQIGYKVNVGQRNYATGFMGIAYPVRESDSTYINCNSSALVPKMNVNNSDVIFSATDIGPDGRFPTNDDFADSQVVNEMEYKAMSIGSLRDGDLDVWSIDHKKNIVNELSGI